MRTALQLGVCPTFLGEVRGALAGLGLDSVGLEVVPTTCGGGPPCRPIPVPEGTERVSLVCSPPGRRPGEVAAQEQCLHLVAGKGLVDALQQGGAYVVTPGWLRRWRQQLEAWGFDQAQARSSFSEAIRELVLLDTGTEAGAQAWLRELSEHLGLPGRCLPVGLEHLQARLAALVAGWRLRAESARVAAGERRAAELAMALDLVRELSGAMTEEEAARRIVALCTTLFAPRRVVFIPLQGQQVWTFPPGAVGPPTELLAALPGEVEVVGEGSFLVRLATLGKPVAALWVEDLEFPARRGEYLELARSVAELCAMAVVAARTLARQRQVELALRQAQKLESVRRLAAGLAHEINTPVQYVGDDLAFLAEGLGALERLAAAARALREKVAAGTAGPADALALAAVEEEVDLGFLLERGALAAAQASQGLERIATLVRSMRDFAHAGSDGLEPLDLERAVRSTLELARPEYAGVAELSLELAPLPPVRCYPAELNQVLLDLVMNAAHAIADAVRGSEHRGLITVRTWAEGDQVLLSVTDTGTGIAPEVQDHVFEQFFTTKEVGRGTGMGLAVAWQVVVEHHQGALSFETRAGAGTTFLVRIPIDGPDPGVSARAPG